MFQITVTAAAEKPGAVRISITERKPPGNVGHTWMYLGWREPDGHWAFACEETTMKRDDFKRHQPLIKALLDHSSSDWKW